MKQKNHKIPGKLPVVALVGRPNVGKSTLFNRLIKKRKAIVDDQPEVTRDRIFGKAVWSNYSFLLVDTGGFQEKIEGELAEDIRKQALLAIEEADVAVYVGDAKSGITAEDFSLCQILRKGNKPVLYLANKIDGPEQEVHLYEFYRLGVTEILPVSASHGYGISKFMDTLTRTLKKTFGEPVKVHIDLGTIRLSIVGRPNAGKSSLVNRLLGTERILVSSEPGTTRDALDVELEFKAKKFVLIDTAGIRRKGKTREHLEKLSVIKAIRSIEQSHISILLIDSEIGITDQDCRIAGYIAERSRGCIIAINKIDLFKKDRAAIDKLLQNTRHSLKFMPYAPIITISAVTGEKISKIFPLATKIYEQYKSRVSTSTLNQFLEEITFRHEPPIYRNRRVKFYYATQVRTGPPTIVIFCNYPEGIHFSYRRYLTNELRRRFSFDMIPIRLIFRSRTSK